MNLKFCLWWIKCFETPTVNLYLELSVVTYFMWFKVPTSSDKLTNKINWDIAKKMPKSRTLTVHHDLWGCSMLLQPSNIQIYLSMNQLFTNCFLQGWHCSYSSFILVPVCYRLAADIKVQIVRWLKISIILFPEGNVDEMNALYQNETKVKVSV